AYEDKVARHAVRVADLFNPTRFSSQVADILDFHNFVLTRYFEQPALDAEAMCDALLAQGERIKPLVVDVTHELAQLREPGANMRSGGAQAALLDIDHGTYPFFSSSTTAAGGAATATGLGPRYFDHVLGSVKGWATRVGAGPFPRELFDATGEHLSRGGHE